jgi:hypothetical protein
MARAAQQGKADERMVATMSDPIIRVTDLAFRILRAPGGPPRPVRSVR